MWKDGAREIDECRMKRALGVYRKTPLPSFESWLHQRQPTSMLGSAVELRIGTKNPYYFGPVHSESTVRSHATFCNFAPVLAEDGSTTACTSCLPIH